MLLHDSRRDARVDSAGRLATLDEQDRRLWDHGQIAEGLTLVEAALRMGRPGPYQIQAAIAALHAQADSPKQTDWPQIVALYDELAMLSLSPIVQLNRAAALSMAQGPEAGLAVVDALGAAGVLDHYQLFHAARADMLRRLGRKTEAAAAYDRALALATNEVESTFLDRRRNSL
jgi:RNA polymerase sigma-70 factor (ECF subfamily)